MGPGLNGSSSLLCSFLASRGTRDKVQRRRKHWPGDGSSITAEVTAGPQECIVGKTGQMPRPAPCSPDIPCPAFLLGGEKSENVPVGLHREQDIVSTNICKWYPRAGSRWRKLDRLQGELSLRWGVKGALSRGGPGACSDQSPGPSFLAGHQAGQLGAPCQLLTSSTSVWGHRAHDAPLAERALWPTPTPAPVRQKLTCQHPGCVGLVGKAQFGRVLGDSMGNV